jgi:hypothetical protein
VTGELNIHAYTTKTLLLNDDLGWAKFWHVIQQRGPVYFYPSMVDEDKDKIRIKGLFYVIDKNHAEMYHFGQIVAVQKLKALSIVVHFYPFKSTAAVADFLDE